MQKMNLTKSSSHVPVVHTGKPTMPLSGGRQPIIERKISDPSSSSPKGERYPIPSFFEYRMKAREFDPLWCDCLKEKARPRLRFFYVWRKCWVCLYNWGEYPQFGETPPQSINGKESYGKKLFCTPLNLFHYLVDNQVFETKFISSFFWCHSCLINYTPKSAPWWISG